MAGKEKASFRAATGGRRRVYVHKRIKRALINGRYKDTVFRMLFSDKKNLLSLYNGMTGRYHDNTDDLEIVTLENAVYMGYKNDVSFIADMNMYLYEHQSTYNPNMPLRDLIYIAKEYQVFLKDKSLYSSTLQMIPAPGFVVFYNGTEKHPDMEEMRLSSAFLNLEGEPNLELKVVVLNVNEGHNKELMEQCRELYEYAQFVAKVRGHLSDGMAVEDAVNTAVDECIKNDILKDFLSKNRAEVVEVSIFEYDKDEEEKKLRRAEFEAGKSEGIEIGKSAGIEIGKHEGISIMVNVFMNMVDDGVITLEEAVSRAGMSKDEFLKASKS